MWRRHPQRKRIVIIQRNEQNTNKRRESAEENEDRDVVDTACDSDGYDRGVDNASDFDSDVEERQVESLISKYS